MTTITTPEPRSEEKRLGRRGFLTFATGGLTLGFIIPELSRMGELEAATTTRVNSFLNIATDETVTLTVGSTEMGQGSFSGLAQVLAEELCVDYSKIKTMQGAPTVAVPAPIGTAINTVGSSVLRTNFWKLRDAGAAARTLLIRAAALSNGDATLTNYSVTSGVIRHNPSGKTYTYGSVAAVDATLPLGASLPLIADSNFKVIGKTVPRVDIPSKVDGSAIYGIDIRLPGMVYAVIKHGPAFGATLANTNLRVPQGMIAVVPTKVIAGTGRGTEVTGAYNAYAVVGTNTYDAWHAGSNAQWTLPANAAQLNSAQFLADGKALLTGGTPFVAGGANPVGTVYTVEGTNQAAVDAALTGAAHVVDAVYTLPYVAHACMEVLNCTVDYRAGVSCDIHAPTQSAKGLLQLAMLITGMTEAQIHVHTTYLGGGLGRKAEQDFVSQAIQIGMALNPAGTVTFRPVKLMWPREQDFTRDQYRPMAVIHGKAGVNASGQITGWAYRNVSPSILGQRGVPLGPLGDSQGIEAARALPYNMGTRLTQWVSHPSPIPVGFWRSVGASLNTFAVESLIDELAAAAGQDPYQFRRAALTDPRWIAVLDAAATLGNWNTAPPRGSYRGIAIGAAFNSIVAQVVEISSVTATGIRINKVSIALDSYLTVNPGQVDAQLTGGMVHGMNAALYGTQTFAGGAAQKANFNKSKMVRMGEMPTVQTVVIPNPAALDRTRNIGGVGELGVPTFAPALANAYFKGTGKRQRDLPFFPNATMGD